MKLNQPKGKELAIKIKQDKTAVKKFGNNQANSKFIPLTKHTNNTYW
jgi:hypothetical protein